MQAVAGRKDVSEKDWEDDRARHPGVDRPRHRRGQGGQARAGRRRDPVHGLRAPLPDPGLPDHPQGARHGVPDGAPPPLAALQPPARGAAGAQRGRAGDPRLLLRARLHPHRLADPHRRRLRGDLDAVRDRLLRREGVPLAVRPALPRAGRGGVRQGLLLRPDLPRREVEDPPPPDGVLDGRARGRLPRVRGALQSWPRSSSATSSRRVLDRCQRGAEDRWSATPRSSRTWSRRSRASPTREAIEILNDEGQPASSGATTSAATRRRSSPARSTGR